MSAAGNLDWLYHALGWTLAAAGLLLLLWSLFWDRSRGRRRCPKCWYDMAGLPGLKCPECGREARRERLFHRTRRRPKAAILAVVLILGAAAIPVVAFFSRGWSAMPTTLVIATLELKGWPRTNMGAGPGYANEIAKRQENLSGWQRDFVMRRMARYWAFDYRKEWPADVPFAIRLADEWWYADGGVNCTLRARVLNETNEPGSWVFLYPSFWRGIGRHGDVWDDGFFELAALPQGASEVVLELEVVHLNTSGELDQSQRPSWSGTVSYPVKIRAGVDEVIRPVRSPAIDKEVREAFVARSRSPIGLHRPGDRVNIFGFALNGAPRPLRATLSVVVEFTRGTRVVGSSSVWTVDSLIELPFEEGWQEIQELKFDDPGWFVRIRSNPELALRDIESSSYWSGEVVIPSTQVRQVPPLR
jgi:hypothetical protein